MELALFPLKTTNFQNTWLIARRVNKATVPDIVNIRNKLNLSDKTLTMKPTLNEISIIMEHKQVAAV